MSTSVSISIIIGFANNSTQEIKGLGQKIEDNENDKILIVFDNNKDNNDKIPNNIKNKHIRAWTLSVNYSDTNKENYEQILIYFDNDKNTLTIFKKEPQPTETKLQSNGKNENI